MERPGPALQRASTLNNLTPLLTELGVSIEEVLSGTGVSADDFRPDRFIPYAAVLEIFDRAAALTGCEDIGLRLGLLQSLPQMGPVGEVMRNAATLGEALADFAAFQITNCTGATVYLHHAGDEVVWGYGIYDAVHAATPHIHDMVLAVGSVLLAKLTRGAIRPVEYATMRPNPSDPAPWRRLGAPIRFGQGQTCMFLSRADMALPLPTANRIARDAALTAISEHLDFAPWGWAGRTRHAMRSLMLSGQSKLPGVAHHLDIHPRTLQRALRMEGTSFEEIKDGVRYSVARELLTLTLLPVGDIAASLDFASPSAFIRAFYRWSGISPTDWRNFQRMTVNSP